MPEYLLILLLLFIAAVGLQRTYKVKAFRSTSHLVLSYAVFFAIGMLWDQLAIARGHWFFGEKFLVGPRIGYMPFEEFGFIIVVPYFVIVIYKMMEKRQSLLK